MQTQALNMSKMICIDYVQKGDSSKAKNQTAE